MEFHVHWWAPLQAKGFLKIVEMFIALVALSLVAGFTVEPHIDCIFPDGGETVATFEASTKYPFRKYKLDNGTTEETHKFSDEGFSQGAEFFVAWGSLTLFYGVIAILVYMLVTANERLEKIFDYIVWVDLVFHVVWAICWFIASVEWAVGFNSIRDSFHDILTGDTLQNECRELSGELENHYFEDTYVQASIAVVFGFLSLLLWVLNIWWVLIDTSFYIQWKAQRSGTSAAQNF